jgi:hypothetical protein
MIEIKQTELFIWYASILLLLYEKYINYFVFTRSPATIKIKYTGCIKKRNLGISQEIDIVLIKDKRF